MAITNFKPIIWSSSLLSSLKKALVYASPGVVNRDYEGEISQAGDSVRITSISRPTISTYTPNSTTVTPEALNDANRTLVVDQMKYFSFQVDDVDKRQAKNGGAVLSEGMEEAAYGIADTIDQYVAALYTGVASANLISTTSVTTGDLAYTMLVNLGTKLTEANVPMIGRYVVIPPWFHGLLQLNTNFINAEKSLDGGAALRNGVIGRAAGFEIRVSNNAPLVTGDDYAIIAGTSRAITFADQIASMEAYRPESAFSDAVKGLHVYGAKLVRPDGIAVAYASVT